VGLHLRLVQAEALTLWLEGRYHRVDYEGEGQWNLRTDFAQSPSFRQTAEGDGWTITGGGSYAFSENQTLGAEVSYRSWTADEGGIDTVYFANGAKARTQFNEAEWQSWSIALRYAYLFD
jgi:long-subunit fatty acid transport protein